MLRLAQTIKRTWHEHSTKRKPDDSQALVGGR